MTRFLDLLANNIDVIAIIVGVALICVILFKLYNNIKKDVADSVDSVIDSLDNIESCIDEDAKTLKHMDVKMMREQLLKFADDITHGVEHTKEYYEYMISLADNYSDYYSDNADIDKCTAAIKLIYHEYMKRRHSGFIEHEDAAN